MPATIDTLDPANPKRVAILASNPAVSPVTGWPIGFWWSELAHPYWELTEHGYEVDIYSPDGGPLTADQWSDPRDDSGYSAHELLSLGFISSPAHAALVEQSRPLGDLDPAAYDAIFLAGGQAPMVTFVDEPRVHEIVRRFHEAGKVTAIVCHATSVLLRATLSDGSLLVAGKTWTGLQRGGRRGRVRRPAHAALPDRGGGAHARGQELHRERQVQAVRRARWAARHRAAAVLGWRGREARDRGSRGLTPSFHDLGGPA
jgi:putative intracellular protease/amidase